MFTVELKVNGKVIEELSAVNKGHADCCDCGTCDGSKCDNRIYKLSNDVWIEHQRSDGAIVLAIKMLETMKVR